MLFKTLSAAVYGIDANIIEVEVDVSGIKTTEDHFLTVGLPDAAVRESRTNYTAWRVVHISAPLDAQRFPVETLGGRRR